MNASISSIRATTSSCLYALRQSSQPVFRPQICLFSSSSQLCARQRNVKTGHRKRDNNRLRGFSAIRSRGNVERKIFSIRPRDLPVPNMQAALSMRPRINEEHGLWGFFNKDKSPLTDPSDLGNHGRSWTKRELWIKSYEDLHQLWWKCHFEKNRLSTETHERKRAKPGYGQNELDGRKKAIDGTMTAIRETLVERYEAWDEARTILEKDEDPDVMIASGELQWRKKDEFV